jgi:hypothetical protein
MARKPDPATTAAASATELAAELAAEPADRLEQLFEARVARALDRLGVPRGEQIRELTTLLEQLTDRIDALGATAIKSPMRAATPDEPAGLAAPLVSRAATPRRSRRSPAAAAANPKPEG